MDLFNLTPVEISKLEICGNCKHRERHQCNSKVFQYCGIRKSNRTTNGLLKIKCKSKACELFEETEK